MAFTIVQMHIATLLVTKVFSFTDEEIGQMVTEVFVSLLKHGE